MTERDERFQVQGREEDVVRRFQELSAENAQLIDDVREAYSQTRAQSTRALAQAWQRIQQEARTSDMHLLFQSEPIDTPVSARKKITALTLDAKKPSRMGWFGNTLVAVVLLTVMIGSVILVYSHLQTQTSVGSGNKSAATATVPTQWPEGEDTYWANFRYHQLTGYWIPWQGSPNQWVAGAQKYGWQVSAKPHLPSILVLMPGVQGAGVLGHVAVVEKIVSESKPTSVYTSNYNWYTNGGGKNILSYATVTTGSGVYFIWHR